jgi:hypothetical protein
MKNNIFSQNIRTIPRGSKYVESPPGRTAREYLREFASMV